jgi:hypothetical protein
MMSGARLLFGRLMSEYGIRVSGRSAPVTSLPRQASGDLTRNFEGFLAVKHHQGGRVSGLEADGQAREATRKLSEELALVGDDRFPGQRAPNCRTRFVGSAFRPLGSSGHDH